MEGSRPGRRLIRDEMFLAGELGKSVMVQEHAAGTAQRPAGITVATGHLSDGVGEANVSGASSEPVAGLNTAWPAESPPSYGLLQSFESFIQRYPWPTVMLGIGVGYLLARRVR